MIAYVKGELAYASEDGIIVECNGIGYHVRVPMSILSELPSLGEIVRIHTYMHVREDAMQLYGFVTRDDLNIFKLLIGVNGIGPKAALGILSTITPDDLRFAVLSDDAKAISKAPGIGAKTASKLILELKDKLKLEDVFESRLTKKQEEQEQMTLPMTTSGVTAPQKRNEAVQALVALGYSNSEALKMVRQVTITDDMDVEQVLKLSLKNMSF